MSYEQYEFEYLPALWTKAQLLVDQVRCPHPPTPATAAGEEWHWALAGHCSLAMDMAVAGALCEG